MVYMSFSRLAEVIREGIYQIDRKIDLVVGIPRSGMIPATLIALYKNLKVCSIDEFVENLPISTGSTRPVDSSFVFPKNSNHVLLVDDSLYTGESMRRGRDRIIASGYTGAITTCAVFTLEMSKQIVDIYFQYTGVPRAFEWNLFHSEMLEKCFLDLDGILCLDPPWMQDEDKEYIKYQEFLQTAVVKFLPTRMIGGIVTTRLEKYRGLTEEWLSRHRILYKNLYMLDLPDAETRRRLGIHAQFKSDVYRVHPEIYLFVESDPNQAEDIYRMTRRPVVCFSTQESYY